MLTYKEYNDLEKIIDAVKIGSKYISSELHAPIMQYFIKNSIHIQKFCCQVMHMKYYNI
ncbi:MAG: hypothetical protein IPJ13_07890 [Saprospiraceae bacterium]|nr:hypothetical protein [Saprospiraceae bacterium]